MFSECPQNPKDNSKTLINVWTREKMLAVSSRPHPHPSLYRPQFQEGVEDMMGCWAYFIFQHFHFPGVKWYTEAILKEVSGEAAWITVYYDTQGNLKLSICRSDIRVWTYWILSEKRQVHYVPRNHLSLPSHLMRGLRLWSYCSI